MASMAPTSRITLQVVKLPMELWCGVVLGPPKRREERERESLQSSVLQPARRIAIKHTRVHRPAFKTASVHGTLGFCRPDFFFKAVPGASQTLHSRAPCGANHIRTKSRQPSPGALHSRTMSCLSAHRLSLTKRPLYYRILCACKCLLRHSYGRKHRGNLDCGGAAGLVPGNASLSCWRGCFIAVRCRPCHGVSRGWFLLRRLPVTACVSLYQLPCPLVLLGFPALLSFSLWHHRFFNLVLPSWVALLRYWPAP